MHGTLAYEKELSTNSEDWLLECFSVVGGDWLLSVQLFSRCRLFGNYRLFGLGLVKDRFIKGKIISCWLLNCLIKRLS